ncbi:hypothetical protein HID58_056555 [Brassica napus]|uniref:Uncharacterized protein n=1 Tax=Brassica napus TaxID=3708 RepID=A0ABQ8APW1_BRANA|nr:hypothetical protein HID58_056555 [Brassica napus]
MTNRPSSRTTSQDNTLPQISPPPWRHSKAISAHQMTSLPSRFLGKKRANLFSPHFTTLDHIGHLHSQKLLQTVDSTPTALLRIKRLLPRTIVKVEDIINHTRTLPPLLRVQHFVHQLSLVFLWFVNKNHQCLPPRFLRRPIFMGATTKGITDQVHLPVNDVSYFSKHALRHVGDWLQRVRGAVDAEGFEIVEHVCLGTHRDKACVGRHGRKRPDDDQAVSAVEFPVENVETGVTRVAVSEESVDTVLGDSQLRPPLVELRGSNEFPESLGDEGESWGEKLHASAKRNQMYRLQRNLPIGEWRFIENFTVTSAGG